MNKTRQRPLLKIRPVSLLFDVGCAAALLPLPAIVAHELMCSDPDSTLTCVRATPDEDAIHPSMTTFRLFQLPSNMPHMVVRLLIPIPYCAVRAYFLFCTLTYLVNHASSSYWLIKPLLWYLDIKTTINTHITTIRQRQRLPSRTEYTKLVSAGNNKVHAPIHNSKHWRLTSPGGKKEEATVYVTKFLHEDNFNIRR